MLTFLQFVTEMTLHPLALQPWGTAGNPDDLYYTALTLAQGVRDRLQQILARAASGRGKILIGFKELAAFKSKLGRGKAADQIHDILRSAILLNTQAEVEDVVRQLRRSQTIHEVEFKDKGTDPAYGYYGSWHLKIVINSVIVEVQVMTRRLWTYKNWAHDFYQDYRDKGDTVPASAKAQSKYIFSMGNRSGEVYKPKPGKPQPRISAHD